MGPLETLLELQAHDTAGDRIRHRRSSIAERARLAEHERDVAALDARIDELRTRREGVAQEERRYADEATGLEARAKDDETTLYSGEIASPRELQALQADIDQLRRHRDAVEERQLDVMEVRERIETELAEAETARGATQDEADRVGAIVREQEAACDAELQREQQARDALARQLPQSLLAAYERARSSGSGIGAARLVGDTCQGCHLSLPATEVTRIRKQPADAVSFCDNCGCVLVPS